MGEALDNGVGATGLLEQTEHALHGAAYFVVGIHDDAALVVVAKAHRQGESQLTLLRLVQLAAQEAPAQEMQLRLGHRALQAKQQSVVEVPGVVAAIRIDHQRVGQGTQLQQPMPIEVGARQARDFQRKHRSDLAHRDVGHQGLEVLPTGALRARHAQVPIQHADRALRPAQGQRLVLQRILALGALLVVAHLSQRRLADIDVRRLAQLRLCDRLVHR